MLSEGAVDDLAMLIVIIALIKVKPERYRDSRSCFEADDFDHRRLRTALQRCPLGKVSLRCVQLGLLGPTDVWHSSLSQTKPIIVPHREYRIVGCPDIGRSHRLASSRGCQKYGCSEASIASSEPVKQNMSSDVWTILLNAKSRFKTYAKQCGLSNATTHRSHPRKWLLWGPVDKRSRCKEPAKEVIYMCPEYWCPISEVPMSREEVEKKMEYANRWKTIRSVVRVFEAMERQVRLTSSWKHPLSIRSCCFLKTWKYDDEAYQEMSGQTLDNVPGWYWKSFELSHQEEDNMSTLCPVLLFPYL
jgi:hypothetical protein